MFSHTDEITLTDSIGTEPALSGYPFDMGRYVRDAAFEASVYTAIDRAYSVAFWPLLHGMNCIGCVLFDASAGIAAPRFRYFGVIANGALHALSDAPIAIRMSLSTFERMQYFGSCHPATGEFFYGQTERVRFV